MLLKDFHRSTELVFILSDSVTFSQTACKSWTQDCLLVVIALSATNSSVVEMPAAVTDVINGKY
jgi:hypothetical protein